MTRVAPSPISFAVSIARLPAKGMPVRLEADETQRSALAAAHELVAVDRFMADLLVTDWKRDGVKVTGTVAAAIVQSCTLTLEPVAAHVEEDILAFFVPEGSKLALPDAVEGGEILLDAEGPDAPETFTGDMIDIGRLAEEFFGLGIDPYPRAPGASLDIVGDGVDEPRGPLYEKLKALKQKP